MLEVTLNTVPLYKVLAYNYISPENVLTNGVASNWAKTSDQIMLYWFPMFKEVVVANLTFVPANTPGNAASSVVGSTSDAGSALITAIKETADNLATSECAASSALGTNHH